MNQMKANILGHTLCKLGSAILAGYAAGIYQDLKAVAQHVSRPGRRYEVDLKLHQFYRPYSQLYAEVFASLAPVYTRLVKLATRAGVDSEN
ncbi:hypothetical protein [Moorella sp. ACPs]|uniref:hypothetical protein n=1 Tax=Neomoorella carbonis TaxID=3062783 RepID=UPI003873A3EC